MTCSAARMLSQNFLISILMNYGDLNRIMVEYTPIIIFFAIFVAVPLQFLLSPSSSDVRYHLHKLRNSLSHFSRLFLYKEAKVDEVIDVSEDEKETKYFGGSLEPRDPRPPYVKYRVGDVVRHKIHGYRGVIIGWDEKAIAPQSWLEKTHKGRKEWSEMPNYSVIIDTRDRLIPQLAYVVEENIELGEGRVWFLLSCTFILDDIILLQSWL
ncbi:hemimethylated DNA binding domain protein [Onchocerca flexuosa]|uniref:Hemimethylated DNA binding domain protein n=2 Tax=Onchocerca flexuosa TaxID=387005 RepID=A0A238BSU1_9BILA|nr:hemimethylated DNA binding domain protein [Onchocerca flexuosa]